MRLLLIAIQFLTRLPVPSMAGFEPGMITRSARWFSLVGQIVGLVSALVLIGASYVWNGWIAAILAIGAGILVTGAFHEDGLADTVDGIGGGAEPARRLEIMRDSRIGTYGAAALLLALLLKAGALASLTPITGALALIAGHGMARAAAVVTMTVTSYAPGADGGKWKPVPEGVQVWEMGMAILIALWPLALLGGSGVAGLVLGAVFAGIMTLAAVRKLGGYTGDALGAVEQMFEVGFLLGVVAIEGVGRFGA